MEESGNKHQKSWALLTAASYNYVVEFLQPKLKPSELKILLLIIRKTIGWRQKEAWISPSKMIEGTGCGKVSISKAMERLCVMQHIEIRADDKHWDALTKYGIKLGRLNAPKKRKVYGWLYKKEAKSYYSVHPAFTQKISQWINKNKNSGDEE